MNTNKKTNGNLEILNNKINYIGFKLEEVPEFLKTVTPLNYRVPKIYDETTYKIYKYVKVKDIDIMITPTDRLDELEEKYKTASPLFTYMKPDKKEDLEKYALFLRMINKTRTEDIQKIEEEQNILKKEIPFNVKFSNNFKWQIYYSDFANKYFMLASTNETDNSPMFYLLKKKIEDNKRIKKNMTKTKKETLTISDNNVDNYTVFIPICNEEYSEKILKKSEIADLENYLWYFTKDWPNIYEVTDLDGMLSIQIAGNAVIYDKMKSSYNIKLIDKKEAQKEYKLIKALFIMSYDTDNEYEFNVKINDIGGLDFYYKDQNITYDNLPEFMKQENISKSKENKELKLETKDLQADIKDMKKAEEDKIKEYQEKEKQIVAFLECKKTFFGKIKYFFKVKRKTKETEDDKENTMNKDRLKEMLSQDKNRYTDIEEILEKPYTVEDIIKTCKELEISQKENTNVKLDIKALKNKIENIDRKIKNATLYIEEIDKHKKSIFEFWKFANKDEQKVLSEGEENIINKDKIRKTFDYEEDIDDFASNIDKKQRETLSKDESDAVFASNYVLDGINIVSKDKLLNDDENKIEKILNNLKEEYEAEINRIEEKDFDIFGNISEDKTKIKTLKNNKHREVEKDKFKVLNINLNTEESNFIDTLKGIKNTLLEEANKISTPCDISLYKASYEKLTDSGFDKFSINPFDTLDKLEKNKKSKNAYLYKINIPEGTNIIFYSNIMFFDNNNQTLPLGMDIAQETLINLDLYKLELTKKTDFNINVFVNEYNTFIRNVKVYEYNLKQKDEANDIDKKTIVEKQEEK